MDALAYFRALVPEFSAKTDDEVNAMIEIAKPNVSSSRFGNFYNQALAYYAAHLFSLNDLIVKDGGNGAAVTSGPLVSEREGDLQRQYGFSNAEESMKPLDRTIYGQEFQVLAKKCIVPALTR